MAPLICSSFLLIGLSIAAPTLRAADNLSRDAATLQKFAETLSSDPNSTTDSWKGSDVCSYKGIVCDIAPYGVEAVASIDINNAHLGSNLRLDGFLDTLLDITLFHANSNNFVGTVPSLSRLQYLYELDLSNNNLTGNFPETIFEAPLTFLDLRFNQLTGPLPDKLFKPFKWTLSMDAIFLNNNQFNGTIPETGPIETLYITLANNQLEGEIPESFANNKKLKELLLLGNKLTGNVPEKLCGLKLDVLDVSGNEGLTGTLGPKCKALVEKGVLNIEGTGLEV